MPSPATVGLFPGTYAESVDLDAMGSAAGGGQGDLTLQALDAGGMRLALAGGAALGRRRSAADPTSLHREEPR